MNSYVVVVFVVYPKSNKSAAIFFFFTKIDLGFIKEKKLLVRNGRDATLASNDLKKRTDIQEASFGYLPH